MNYDRLKPNELLNSMLAELKNGHTQLWSEEQLNAKLDELKKFSPTNDTVRQTVQVLLTVAGIVASL